MRIRVRAFAALREALGKEELEVEIEPGATIASALETILPDPVQRARFEPSLLFAVNRAYARADHILSEGDELALLPPVSGG